MVGGISLIRFHYVSRYFLFLSPDGVVEPLMMLMLRLLLISLGVLGVALLMRTALISVVARIHRRIVTSDRQSFLLGLIVVALALRFASVLLMPFEMWDDYLVYDDLAQQWAAKGGYYDGDLLTAYRPPGYPFFLSRLYVLFGHSYTAGAVANILLGTAIVLLTYLIVRRIWSEPVARWSALLLAIFSGQILFCNLLASEVLFTALFLASILAFIESGGNEKRPLLWVLVGGLVLGLATLTRTITVYYLVLVMIFWLGRRVRVTRVAAFGLVALTGFMGVVAPWMVRNHYAVGKATICTLTGMNLYVGNQPGSGMGYSVEVANSFDRSDPSREVYNDSVAWHRAWEYIREDPIAFVKRGVVKVGFLYASDFDPLHHWLRLAAAENRWDQYVMLALGTESYYVIVLLLAAIGMVLFVSRRELRSAGGWLFVLTILLWTGVHSVFYAKGRYHFPVVPMLCAFAAVAIVRLVERRGC